MRALQIHKFGGPDNLKLENVPIPSVGDSKVLVRVKAAGINPVDTYIREGAYATLPKLPAILGREVAGIVEEVGDSVSSIKVFKKKIHFARKTLNILLFYAETYAGILSLQFYCSYVLICFCFCFGILLSNIYSPVCLLLPQPRRSIL